MESSSFSGSSKRGKAPGNIGQAAHCLVDGCSADLSQCRDYHRRHKVCEVHSKTPKVTIGGREQRFCQQCSRFHSLVEFDEGKRSCRKRLDGHNRRRRKPQPESLTRSTGLDFSAQQGTRLVSFSAPQNQILLPSYSWSMKTENENEMANNQQQQQQQLQLMSYMNQLELVQGSSSSICEAFVDPNGGAAGLNHCHGALSLLSSPTPSPSLMDYHHHPTTAASTLHFQEMFPEGSSTPGCGAHQTLSFSGSSRY